MSKHRQQAMHVEDVSRNVNGKTYSYPLLRTSYREDGKVKHKTIANLSGLPADVVDYIRSRLAGGKPHCGDGSFRIKRSLPHGHVAAVLGAVRQVGLDAIIGAKATRERQMILALIIARIIQPGSKLATFNGLTEDTATSTLAEVLGLEDLKLAEVYQAMDWLLARQKRIENKLGKKHLKGGVLVLYDVSSSYYTGQESELVKRGYSRDHRSDCPQIVYGLLCDANGRPICVEVFPGNTADPKTFTQLVRTVRQRFGIEHLVIAGDRGMITSKRIDEDLRNVEGLAWISALRSDAIRKLVNQQTIQPSLFDERDLAEVSSDDFPGERLVVCRNPRLADKRAHVREELLKRTEEKLEQVTQATQRTRAPLSGESDIGVRVGRVLEKSKVGKHFDYEITENGFTYSRNADRIAAEAALDGLYVVRSEVPSENMSSEQLVGAYKSLSRVERAFRCLKTVDLQVRPIYHHMDERIKAHVFLCMLAYYAEWHLREQLRPLLFDDEERELAEATRESIVGPAPRSRAAQSKDWTRQTADGLPVQSFRSLLSDLGTLSRHEISLFESDATFQQLTEPTPLQSRALTLLNVTL